MKEEKKQKKEEVLSQKSQEPTRRRYARRMGDRGGGGAIWLISFTDVMALMLTFFVLLFAMSNPREENWEGIKDTVQNNFNKYAGQLLNRGHQDAVSIEKVNFSQALDLNYLRTLIASLIEREPSLKVVKFISQSGTLILSLPEDLLFDPGEAKIKEDAGRALFTLANILSRIKNRVEVVGHTDPRPISTEDFPSNWELSMMRAAQVAAVLENVGYGQSVVIRGQAGGRYLDLEGSVPESKRLELSRRVDILIMEDDGKRVKLFDIGSP